MNPFDILNQLGRTVGRELSGDLGREIFGGGRRRRGHMGGWGGGGGGMGWVIPAMILGRIVEEATRQHSRQQQQQPQWQGEAWPPQPQGPTPSPWGNAQPQAEPAPKTIQCVNCRLEVKEGFEVCPHCGRNVNKRECRYCGRDVPKDQSGCLGCGAPVQRVGDSVLG